MALKNFVELRDEEQQEVEIISKKIETLENEIDNHNRNPAEVGKQKARIRQLDRLYRWRGQLNGAIEVNQKFGKEPNGTELVFKKIAGEDLLSPANQ